MKTFILLLSVFLVLVMVSTSPIAQNHKQAAVPPYRYVHRRSLPVKGGRPVHKGRPALDPLNYNLRKGEYVCGNKVCRLKPGEVPKNCNGVCQHRIA